MHLEDLLDGMVPKPKIIDLKYELQFFFCLSINIVLYKWTRIYMKIKKLHLFL